ncbi:MAG: DUF4276 family protein [Candidatus Symbiobacter sp.]|nr:DUF4276 family protein [Candidatus Symbiobacter sp.]
MSKKTIKIYVEGANGECRTDLTNALDSVLRDIVDQARNLGIKIEFVAGYGRTQCYAFFANEHNDKKRNPLEKIVLLLMDAETKQGAEISAKEHLHGQDHFVKIKDEKIEADRFFLMTTAMESWIIADINAMKRFFVSLKTEEAKIDAIELRLNEFVGEIPKSDDFAKGNLTKLFDELFNQIKTRDYDKTGDGFKMLKFIDAKNACQKSASFNVFYHGLQKHVTSFNDL